jgi:hypothetical protein
MVIRRRTDLLPPQQLVEVRLLAGRKLRQHRDAAEPGRWIDGAPVVPRLSFGMHAARQFHRPEAVNPPRDAILLRGQRGQREQGGADQTQHLQVHAS